MVNADGQLYTIEGFAAALIMIITAFLVVNATSIYTAGDTHINDMQLEALGTDALKMINVAPNDSAKTPLQEIIENATMDGARFNATFSSIINNGTFQNPNTIQYNAIYTYRNRTDNSVASIPINSSRNITGGEHTVRATKWVIVNKTMPGSVTTPRAVLLEVLLWRD